ncbi:MAG: helix-turn-helix transcriptional regulator [Lachnospiraceae bacterium]|nr:helix-turn-helix transcriptional regulator [Lachnospiraceae bacterium]
MSFAERLKKLRKANGYTQVSLAAALGVSKGTVAMWETGKRTPDYEIIKMISDMFDRRMDYVLGYSDDDSSIKLTVEQIDIFRQFLRLDAYGQACVRGLIQREAVRCRDQGTEQDISNIKVGIQKTSSK